MSVRLVLALGGLLGASGWCAAQGDAPARAPAPSVAEAAPELLWIRTRQDESRILRLQLAIREFVAKDAGKPGPSITLYGAVHIADRAFYKRLDQLLEENHDVILYEGVKPAGMHDAPLPEGAEGDAQRAERTTERLRLAWAALERWRRASPSATPKAEGKGGLPNDLGQIAARMGDEGFARERSVLAATDTDAWERPFRFTRSPDGATYSLGSYGRDNALGGDGPDSDVFIADLKPLSASETSSAPNLQERLAETFGLTFQLNEMDHEGPKWVNSDMSIDEVERALGFDGGDDGAEGKRNMLFEMLDGSSFPAKIASTVLSLIESIPGMAPRMKVMMLEMLANIDEKTLSNAVIPGMDDTKQLMKVIIEDRNQVVIDDLARIIKERPNLKSIGVIYGAGHLPDLARRLEEQLGYTHKGGKWLTAIRVDLDAEGITDEEMEMTRRMMAMQMKMLSGDRKTEPRP